MRYTIITPTICRPSLLRLCASIDAQTQSSWQHLLVVDMPRGSMSKRQRGILDALPRIPRRSYFYCERNHHNYGHTCRHRAWDFTAGEYILYVDDDDYLADDAALSVLDQVTAPWAVFPILRQGKRFLHLPPGVGATGTGMFMHRKGVGRWPDLDSYHADGAFAEQLRRQHSYQVVDSGPIVIQPKSSFGVANADGWVGTTLGRLKSRWLRYRYATISPHRPPRPAA